jgi:glycine/D-amino acid oxidase-like deaminating enzyme
VTDVRVVDLDLAGVYASSELNAGGARATWWQPVNIDTCRATLEFFREHREEFGFRDPGYLWLYADAALHAQALDHLASQNERGLGVEALAVPEVAERFPLLDRNLDELVGATFSPRDGLVNPNAVRSWYRREAESLGVRFSNRHYAVGVATARVAGVGGSLRRVAAVDVAEVEKAGVLEDADRIREILVTHRVPPDCLEGETRIDCDAVINCLGAWSPIFSAKVGVSDVTEPVRRQISLVDVHVKDLAPGASLAELGMVVDASDLYFHPEGPHVLAGYSIPDESPGFDFDYDGAEFFERYVWPRLAHRCSSFERCGHVRGWSGLYAVTPDRSGIAGRVEGFANLFEAHSFTGRGVMQSFAVGAGIAELVSGGRYESQDLSALTRERFADPTRWVGEALHI